MCDHLDDLEASMLGTFESLEIETGEGLDGREERLCLRFGQHAGLRHWMLVVATVPPLKRPSEAFTMPSGQRRSP